MKRLLEQKIALIEIQLDRMKVEKENKDIRIRLMEEYKERLLRKWNEI